MTTIHGGATTSERLKWENEYLGLYVSAHPLAGLKKYFQKKVVPLNQLTEKAVGKSIKVGGIIQSFRKITTKKGDMMAILTLEDPFGKVDAVMFPKTYSKNSSTLLEDQLLIVDGILEKRIGEHQIVIQNATPISLEKLQEAAKKEKLWTENEKIDRVTRQSSEEEDLAEAEEALDVAEEEAKDLDEADNDVESIIINREVDKEFFVKLKAVFEKHPGNQKIQLVIGEKILPAPMTVTFTSELTAEIDELMKEKN